jgi:hypothetical protein
MQDACGKQASKQAGNRFMQLGRPTTVFVTAMA